MNKLVTVAIASYNNAPYLERCVKSVMNQSYQNLEILIVDDGSRDDSISIMNGFRSDNRIRIITKENGGLSSVRQMSLEEANGEYICFIDADDYLNTKYVEIMTEKLEIDKTDICVCSTRFEDINGNKLDKETNALHCEKTKEPYWFSLELMSDLNENNTKVLKLSDSWNKMYRLAFVQETEVRFCMPKGLNGTDALFNNRLYLYRPKYSCVEEELYNHVIYDCSAVHRKKKDLLNSSFVITNSLIEDAKKLGIFNTMKKKLAVRYYERLFHSFLDVYKENDTNRSRRSEFKLMFNRISDYKYNDIFCTAIRASEIQSKVLKIFFLIINNFKPGMPVFFRVYQSVFGI